ncbi:MAG TPA: radical SAM family heme chaperone HemW [Moorella mulderi]|nr:radical SAM family heme chaperone HemW [Moorella mulderi]
MHYPYTHLYIHIPFCLKKCPYCDFISYVGQGNHVFSLYTSFLIRELELLKSLLAPPPVLTLYLGGGTPSLLPFKELERLLSYLFYTWKFVPDPEVTMEVNPATLGEGELKSLRSLGVNRLSLGAQSFDGDLLLKMERTHSVEDVYRLYRAARRAGFDNINIDLIYGLPGQTRETWRSTLAQALALQPEHLSTYGLTLSPTTPWGQEAAAGRLSLPGEEEEVAMYLEAIEEITGAGYLHYEISNFAFPQYRCRHNLAYWYNLPYLGAGVAAASHWGKRRWENTPHLEEYFRLLSQGRFPRVYEERLTPKGEMAETLFMGLRLREGIDLSAFAERFGVALEEVYGREIEVLLRKGLLLREENRLFLAPKALPLANEVFCLFV